MHHMLTQCLNLRNINSIVLRTTRKRHRICTPERSVCTYFAGSHKQSIPWRHAGSDRWNYIGYKKGNSPSKTLFFKVMFGLHSMAFSIICNQWAGFNSILWRKPIILYMHSFSLYHSNSWTGLLGLNESNNPIILYMHSFSYVTLIVTGSLGLNKFTTFRFNYLITYENLYHK